MAELFALCWNNFTENITNGFQTLLCRGDLCDVTLAVEGKLLKAHKIVLSICSPYFQEMFIANPCQHPIIILKDMSSKLMANLLEFMYQGSVNVKQTELQAFMKIAETLQIKGLTTTSPKKSPKESIKKQDSTQGIKRTIDSENSYFTQKKERKTQELESVDVTDENIDNADDFIPVPEISMVETRLESSSLKSRDSNESHTGTSNLKISNSITLNNFGSYDCHSESQSTQEISSKNSFAEVPAVPASGSSITMLSSTSLLHGNCIFNRNNTVATQQGLKTYWLCKSYRISMCKARCITHQGRVISATGVHNHLPHMTSQPTENLPGHTSNMYNSQALPNNHEFLNNSNSIPSSSAASHLIQPHAMHHSYHYMLHPANQIMQDIAQPQINITAIEGNHSLASHHSDNLKLCYNSSDSVSAGSSNATGFKMEHI